MRSTNECGGIRPTVDVSAADAAVVVRPAVLVGRRSAARRSERGMVSAEWAVGIIAAIAIAGVLLAVVTSGPVEEAILDFILMVIKAFSRGL